jgi:hypothetical protein
VPVSGSVEIEEVVYPLDGPRVVALALRAAAVKIVKIFKDKKQLKILKDRFTEEADSRAENAKIILRIQQESPAKGEERKKKKQVDVTFAAGINESPVKQGGVNIDYGGKKKKEVDLGASKPVAPVKNLCARYLAGLLKLVDSAGGAEGCIRSDCRFSHVALKTVTADDALWAALRVNDKELRENLRVTIAACHKLFKS